MKYNELMSRITVTPQMKERVIQNARMHRQEEEEAEESSRASGGNRKVLLLWRYLSAVMAACLVLVCGIVVQKSRPIQPQTEETSGIDLVYSGIEEYSSLEELEDAVGFSMKEAGTLAENLPFAAKQTAYSNAAGIARVDYTSPEGEVITFSKAADDGTDISGDYTEYNAVSEETIENVSVTIKGDRDKVNLAVFSKDGYAYAIDTIDGISREAMIRMVKAVS